MKRIKYDFLSAEINHGTDENPDVKQLFFHKDFPYSDEALEAAMREAYNGEYEIYTVPAYVPVAPRNIVEGEYITIDGVLYKAIMNIPNGGAVIEGQNVVVTTIEEQLYELTKG